MSISTEGAVIPEWDLADRLAKSLRIVDMTATAMADYLEVHRNTVGAWMKGKAEPTRPILIAWALRTGVPFEWLKTGVGSHSGPGPGGVPTEVDDPSSGLRIRRRRFEPSPPAEWHLVGSCA